MNKKILFALASVLIIVAAVFFLKNKDEEPQPVVRVQTTIHNPDAEQAFFPKECTGQETGIQKCTELHGKYSCAAQYCVLPGDQQFLEISKANCLSSDNPTDCLKQAVNQLAANSKWIAADTNKGCFGIPNDIKKCNELGLQWHCKIGVCMPPGTLSFFEKFSRKCGSDPDCEEQTQNWIKKLCIDQFKNEKCLPDSKTQEMNTTVCLISEGHTVAQTYSPKFGLCVDENSFSSYFSAYYMCLTTKAHPNVADPAQMTSPFKTSELCLKNLTAETRDFISSSRK